MGAGGKVQNIGGWGVAGGKVGGGANVLLTVN